MPERHISSERRVAILTLSVAIAACGGTGSAASPTLLLGPTFEMDAETYDATLADVVEAGPAAEADAEGDVVAVDCGPCQKDASASDAGDGAAQDGDDD
jgi:hypothetical protein